MSLQSGSIFTCTVCGKTFDQQTNHKAKQNMEQHIESLHVDGLSYKCASCDKTFGSRNARDTHKSKYHRHGNDSLGIKCNICNLAFQTENSVKVHLDLVHLSSPDIKVNPKCKYCVFNCSDLDVVRKHVIKEHKIKCKKCFTTFEDNQIKKIHMRITHHIPLG